MLSSCTRLQTKNFRVSESNSEWLDSMNLSSSREVSSSSQVRASTLQSLIPTTNTNSSVSKPELMTRSHHSSTHQSSLSSTIQSFSVSWNRSSIRMTRILKWTKRILHQLDWPSQTGIKRGSTTKSLSLMSFHKSHKRHLRLRQSRFSAPNKPLSSSLSCPVPHLAATSTRKTIRTLVQSLLPSLVAFWCSSSQPPWSTSAWRNALSTGLAVSLRLHQVAETTESSSTSQLPVMVPELSPLMTSADHLHSSLQETTLKIEKSLEIPQDLKQEILNHIWT